MSKAELTIDLALRFAIMQLCRGAGEEIEILIDTDLGEGLEWQRTDNRLAFRLLEAKPLSTN